MKVAVLGAGAWGTALAHIVAQAQPVTLWGQDGALLEAMASQRRNEKYLPGVELSERITLEADFGRALAGRDCLLLAVPSKALREVAGRLNGFNGVLITVTKGIEFGTGLTMSAVLEELCPQASVAALSGPSLALEVARGIPTAVVVASRHSETCTTVQNLVHRPAFRTYTSNDILGVEMGGALKNVIAIGAGVCDGLGFGDNSKAALITRGLAEMRRLGVACGARGETFSGLSGLGDLTVTCFSRLSRNRGFGERIGRGESVGSILTSTSSVAEGYPTARSALNLAQAKGVAAPIVAEVHAMLYEGKNPRKAVLDLMTRDQKAED